MIFIVFLNVQGTERIRLYKPKNIKLTEEMQKTEQDNLFQIVITDEERLSVDMIQKVIDELGGEVLYVLVEPDNEKEHAEKLMFDELTGLFLQVIKHTLDIEDIESIELERGRVGLLYDGLTDSILEVNEVWYMFTYGGKIYHYNYYTDGSVSKLIRCGTHGIDYIITSNDNNKKLYGGYNTKKTTHSGIGFTADMEDYIRFIEQWHQGLLMKYKYVTLKNIKEYAESIK